MGGATDDADMILDRSIRFNAARGFVGGATKTSKSKLLIISGFNAARGFVGGATASLAALVPLGGKSPFGKSPKI